jgi:hypothetical protein
MLFGMIGIASSQDFSWGFNSTIGVSRSFTGSNFVGSYSYYPFETAYGQTDYGSMDNIKAKNFSIGLNAQYRLRKRMSIGIEVNYYRNVLSDNSMRMDFVADYLNSYNYATAFIENSVTRSSIQPIFLLDFNITDNFHFYGGLGLDIWSNSKANLELKSMDRYGAELDDIPLYTDDEEFSNLENNSFDNTLLLGYSNISKVYGFYYQMNNIKIGYRHYGVGLEKGLHQLTLGYDIGRYKYQ